MRRKPPTVEAYLQNSRRESIVEELSRLCGRLPPSDSAVSDHPGDVAWSGNDTGRATDDHSFGGARGDRLLMIGNRHLPKWNPRPAKEARVPMPRTSGRRGEGVGPTPTSQYALMMWL